MLFKNTLKDGTDLFSTELSTFLCVQIRNCQKGPK